MKKHLGFLILLAFFACESSPGTVQNTEKEVLVKGPRSPDALYGALFDAVQMARVFPDGKTFADCTAKIPPSEILKRYDEARKMSGFDLKKFVLEHFELPTSYSSEFNTDVSRPPAEHIQALWPVLTRPADTIRLGSTLLPLPKPYVVPGGRFGEVYYWDSYFTMLGLESAGKQDLIGNILDNFAYLIDTYGHIPNGNRAYYLSRSQPPFFSLMVKLSEPDAQGKPSWSRYLPQLEKEYAFWMDGADKLTEQNPTHRRVVLLEPEVVLNRYWDDRPAPRPESYREDLETANSIPSRPPQTMYRHIKAGAESGWDFSSRWNVGTDLKDINTTDIIPVDLNCLLWHLESTLSKGFQEKGDAAKTEYYGKRAYLRERAIRKYFYDKPSGWYMDYDWTNRAPTGVLSLAGVYPLFFAIAEKDQADACAKMLEKTFLKAGGLVTTPNHTGQQWDAPNGWAPLQWMAIAGLREYGYTGLANTVKQRWVKLNTDVYRRTGKMLEKYNVEDLSLEAGGGEYPVQDGFGWTNGVLLRLLMEGK